VRAGFPEWRRDAALLLLLRLTLCAAVVTVVGHERAQAQDANRQDLTYKSIVNAGRPGGMYQLRSSSGRDVCASLLATINQPFRSTATGALEDKEYLLHTGHEPPLKITPSANSNGSISDDLQIVDEPVAPDAPAILLYSSVLGGYPSEKVILASNDFLGTSTILPPATVHKLLSSDESATHVSVRTSEWVQRQDVIGRDTTAYRAFLQDEYSAVVTRQGTEYFALVTSPVLFSEDENIAMPMVVLAFELGWKTALEPECVFEVPPSLAK
jgi:hypothetical protein